MKRIVYATVAAVLVLGQVVTAQIPYNASVATPTDNPISTLNEAVTLDVRGLSSAAIDIRGTFSGTLTPQCTIDNTNWTAVLMTPPNSTTAVTSTTAPGAWTGAFIAGCRYFRVIATSWASGTAVVTIRATQSARGGGGSGGSGTITGADTRVVFFDGADTPAGDGGLTYNKTTDALTVAGTLSTSGHLFTLAGALSTSGANAVTLTTTGATNVTLPTTGTLATLAGTETFTNKTLTSPAIGVSGVRLTGDGDGAITLLGLGDGNDEDLTLNLDDTANTVVVSSSTGVTKIDAGTIAVEAKFNSSDGSTGVTAAGCADFKDGLCTTGGVGGTASLPWFDVTAYGALCDAAYNTGGGADDTAEIQAALDAADDAGAPATVIVPYGVCRISATLNVPAGIHMIGWGGRENAGLGTPPVILWDGADDGVMVLVSVAAANTSQSRFENLGFWAGTMITNKPSTMIRFEGSGGPSPVDTGTAIVDCTFYGSSGNTVEFESGATNFYWFGGRIDDNTGYGIYVDLNDGGSFNAHFAGSFTWASSVASAGLLRLDGEDSGGRSHVQFDTIHTEAGDLTETFGDGTNPYDKSGIFSLGIDSSVNFVQHKLVINNLNHSYTGGVHSHSIIQVTSDAGTAAQGLDRIAVTGCGWDGVNAGTTDANADDEVRYLGGQVTTTVRPAYLSARMGCVNIGTGPNFSGETVNSQVYTRHGGFLMRGMAFQPEVVADLDGWMQAGAVAYVTDCDRVTLGQTCAGGGSNKVLQLWNGSAWKIFAVLN